MKQHVRDNLSRFFYDAGRVSFAVLVIGVIAQTGYHQSGNLLGGVVMTLLLTGAGVTLDLIPAKEV